MDQAAQEQDVGAGAQRHPDIGHRGSAREARIHMNDGRAAFARRHHPLKAHWMILGHGRSHDEDRVRIRQISLRSGCAAASKRCAQTGHGRAVSYPGLVADADHAQTSTEEFLDQVIFFVIERRPAEMGDGLGVHDGLAVLLLDECPLDGSPTAGLRPCPSLSRDPAAPTLWHTDGGTSRVINRPGWVCSSNVSAPLGQRWPREIGEPGSPSIETSSPSLWKTIWPQPTPQYGQIERVNFAS